MSKSPAVRYGSVILLCFCFFRLAWWIFPGIFPVWELQVGDQLMRLGYAWQGSRPVNPDIVYVDLDDKSVSSLKYSLDDNRLYTDLIGILKGSGARAILVDMIFPNCRQDDNCTPFTEQVKRSGNVHLPVILSVNGAGSPPSETLHASPQKTTWNMAIPDTFTLETEHIVITNFKELNEAAAGLGHINCLPDRDGVYRRFPLLLKSAEGVIPSLSLKTVCTFLDIPPDRIQLTPNGTITLSDVFLPDGRTTDVQIPVNRNAQNRIHFSGPWSDTFAHYSFETVLNLGATPEGLMELTDELEGTLVVVSDVSTGSRDFGPVPLSSYYPLSGLHGQFINSVLQADFLVETKPWHNLLIDAFLLLCLTITAVHTRGFRFALIISVLFTILTLLVLYLFLSHRILVPTVRPAMTFVCAISTVMLIQFLQVQQEKRVQRARLTHYFSPSLIEKILNEPERLEGVDKKKLTILFSDIVGFTSWSSTRDAQEIHRTLNKYFEEMAEIVFSYEGTIDKYIGDGLMVFFGDPIDYPDHALRAVKAGIKMQERTKQLRKDWEQTGGMPIEIRIGIHTGEVVVGNMGSQSRMDYTVIGSNVNLAQRLESNCPSGGVLISKQVQEQVGNAVSLRSVKPIQAKGYRTSIPVFLIDLQEHTRERNE